MRWPLFLILKACIYVSAVSTLIAIQVCCKIAKLRICERCFLEMQHRLVAAHHWKRKLFGITENDDETHDEMLVPSFTMVKKGFKMIRSKAQRLQTFC